MNISATETFDWTLEELGANEGKCFEVEIEVELYEEEKQTRNYPGCPASVELLDVRVKTWDNETDTDIQVEGSWQDFANKVAFGLVEERFEDILEGQFCE